MKFIFAIFLLLSAASVFTQDVARIMTYNLLNYPGNDTAVRNPRFRTVIRNTAPDILVVQEMTSQAGMNGFLSNVMNAYGNVYSMGTFINGPDTDNGIFFRASKFRFISNTRIITALRDINEFKIVHISYPADTLRIFSVHLKSSTGSANEIQRAAEVDSLRKFTSVLPKNSLYMVVGDFNIYGDTEPAYFKLKQVTNGSGHFVDAITISGIWNQSIYRQYHTQSPRTRSFGGGAIGGMDDRFDMILFSPGIFNSGTIAYNPGTMTAYGNDGNHYNDSINKRPNTAVSDSIADAIHYASDHIPVYAALIFGNSVGITGNNDPIPGKFYLGQNYPNPFNPVTKIKYDIPSNVSSAAVKLAVFDILGREAEILVNSELKPGEYEAVWDASSFPGGIYFYTLTAGQFRQSGKMILVK